MSVTSVMHIMKFSSVNNLDFFLVIVFLLRHIIYEILRQKVSIRNILYLTRYDCNLTIMKSPKLATDNRFK